MTKIIIYLHEHEQNALNTLAQREYRTAKAQAALIIRMELARLGLIEPEAQPQLIIRSPHSSGMKETGG